jgi:hypothetical protein
MRNYIKYFLTFLILFWIAGFWYILFTGNNSSSNSSKNGHEELSGSDSAKYKLMQRIRYAENKLLDLEKKNRENEAIIEELR